MQTNNTELYTIQDFNTVFWYDFLKIMTRAALMHQTFTF